MPSQPQELEQHSSGEKVITGFGNIVEERCPDPQDINTNVSPKHLQSLDTEDLTGLIRPSILGF